MIGNLSSGKLVKTDQNLWFAAIENSRFGFDSPIGTKAITIQRNHSSGFVILIIQSKQLIPVH
jgi:hypothetical protein